MLPEVFATSGNKQLHHLMVDASKPRNTPDFDCIQELQLTDFDLVLSLEVLEHVPGDQSLYLQAVFSPLLLAVLLLLLAAITATSGCISPLRSLSRWLLLHSL